MTTTTDKIQDLRFRILRGEEVTTEEMRDALKALRENRSSASSASAKKTAPRASTLPDNLDDLFN